MIMGIAALVFIPLLAIALACFLWAIGRSWPLRNRELLRQAISGRSGDAPLPSRLVFLAAAIIALGAGIVALSLADPVAGGLGLTLTGLVLGVLLTARGIAGYTPGWRRIRAAEPFATLDRKTYSPVALFLGAGFLLLVLLRLL